MAIQIDKGFVSGFDNGSSMRYAAGGVITTFYLGEPAIQFYSLMSAGATPLANGDYVAVAGKASLLPGLGHVALAYRNIGSAGSAHFLNPLFPITCILFGVVGIFGGVTIGGLDNSAGLLVAALVAVGVFGMGRLWSMTKACRMLDRLEDTLATYR